jgi:arabinofuranosyltransferase
MAILAALAAFLVILVRTAWVCDDAYITFRTVDNLLHGFGLRWNVAERVQAYTHPLWMLVVAAAMAITREPYFTSIVLSVAFSLVAAELIAFRLATSVWQAVVGVMILASSKAFVDFSTSGLENAASHALIAWYLVALVRSEPGRLTARPIAIASLALVNRQDLLWLLGPSLAVYIVSKRSEYRWRTVLLGLAPLLLWEAFSLTYYGFAVPNTAFAKLHTGIAEHDLLVQGLRYFQESGLHDPITLSAIVASIAIGLVRPGLSRALALGQLFYLAYIVWIGGDFMSGRFFTAPVIVAVAQLAAAPIEIAMVWRVAVASAVVALGFVPSTPNAISGPRFGINVDLEYHEYFGISDERETYYARLGLLRAHHQWQSPDLLDAELAATMRAAGQTVATREAVGMFGYAAGPGLYVVDRFGLGDPLMARLPASGPWRIGHFHRELPAGYIQTLRTGTNAIADAGVAQYFDTLCTITRGPIWSVRRWRAIVSMNLGLDDRLLDPYRTGLAR